LSHKFDLSEGDMKVFIKRFIAPLVFIGILVLVAGRAYEISGQKRDRELLPQVGRSVDIGGRNLNILCTGEGTPSVILEAAGGPGYFWNDIQREIAKLTTACWYDRAGEGWSDSGPYPRTSVAIATDLHELLHRSQIPGPYVLVGWSFGGLNVRAYNGLYPEDVAGMLLVDSAHEDEPMRAPRFFLAGTAPKYLRYPAYLLLKFSEWFGVLRILHARSEHRVNLTRQQRVRALRQQPKSIATDINTGLHVPESYRQAHELARRSDVPLIVLTAGKPQPWSDPEMAREAAAYQQVWIHEMQPQLLQLSSRGRQIVLENSDHGIPDNAPDAVISAVQDIMNSIKTAR
jgi:pimeloyl-ACP methyl ester carboxylesterase